MLQKRCIRSLKKRTGASQTGVQKLSPVSCVVEIVDFAVSRLDPYCIVLLKPWHHDEAGFAGSFFVIDKQLFITWVRGVRRGKPRLASSYSRSCEPNMFEFPVLTLPCVLQ